MNILMVVSSIGGGGAERVATSLASEFVSLGHEVGIFYWDEKGSESYDLETCVKLYRSQDRLMPLRVLSLRAVVRRIPVDIVIGFTDMANITAWAALSLVRHRPVFVATIHSDLRVRDAKMGLSLKTRFLRLLHKQACTHATKMIAVSDGARDSLIGYLRLPPASVDRIYNPVLRDAIPLARQAPRGPPVRVIAAGRLTRAKNYPLMIQAVKILQCRFNVSCHLEIYGKGELGDQLLGLIDELNLNSYVKLCGFTADLHEKLAKGDVFLQTSSWEGFGNVLAEALYAGLRVVSTDCPSGPREILADGKFGALVPVDDSFAVASAIAEELRNPLVIDELELREHLRQFTVAKVAGEYLEVFEGLTN
jgi:glycosyltransferase involved in cell wall biosynthesis